MYRTIETSMWYDPKFKGLPAPGKLLFLYLITNPHAHVSGIYYLLDEVVREETGLKQDSLDRVWDTLSSSELARRDKKLNVVWVKNMLRHQGGHSKLVASAANHVHTLHNSSLVNDFLDYYPDVKKTVSRRRRDRVSKPGRTCLKEQEKEQEIKKTPTESSCGELAFAASPPPAPEFPHFDCVPGRRSRDRLWLLTEAYSAELTATFPGVDVPQECRKAWQWVRANPQKRKTAKGLPDFLYRWLSKAQDQSARPGRSNGLAKPSRDEVEDARVERLLT